MKKEKELFFKVPDQNVFTHQLWGSTAHVVMTVQAKMELQVQVPGTPLGRNKNKEKV